MTDDTPPTDAPTDSTTESDTAPHETSRPYLCWNCDTIVQATAGTMGAYPNTFGVGCDCTTLDSAPAEMTQAETPDAWHIKRPPCCADRDVSELDPAYGDNISDYRCPTCNTGYRWDGTMSEFPTRDPEHPDVPDHQTQLDL